jgi:hypothetical protein
MEPAIVSHEQRKVGGVGIRTRAGDLKDFARVVQENTHW